MSHPPEADLDALLHRLCEAQVEFIVVGGAAAVLHGAPVTTIDLDVVPKRSVENVDRLLRLLESLHAESRAPDPRRLAPTREVLQGDGPVRLSTTLGPLDSMGCLHDGRGYDELLSESIVIRDGDLTFRVLDLPALIEVKGGTGRVRDQMVVPVLLALLRARDGS